MDASFVQSLQDFFSDLTTKNAAYQSKVYLRVWTGGASFADDLYGDERGLTGTGWTTGTPVEYIADTSFDRDPQFDFSQPGGRTAMRNARAMISAPANSTTVDSLIDALTQFSGSITQGPQYKRELLIGSATKLSMAKITGIRKDEFAQVVTIDVDMPDVVTPFS